MVLGGYKGWVLMLGGGKCENRDRKIKYFPLEPLSCSLKSRIRTRGIKHGDIFFCFCIFHWITELTTVKLPLFEQNRLDSQENSSISIC